MYVCAFFCVCVQVEALRRASHPSKESYRPSSIKKLRKLSPMLQRGSKLPNVGATRKKKKYYPYTIFTTRYRKLSTCIIVKSIFLSLFCEKMLTNRGAATIFQMGRTSENLLKSFKAISTYRPTVFRTEEYF
jgi:hypothetical protein